MKDVFSLIQTIFPTFDDEMSQRLGVLRTLSQQGGRVGRQTLAQTLQMTERPLRTLIEELRQQGLIDVTRTGMTLTDIGDSVLTELEKSFGVAHRFYQLEQRLTQYLQVEHCYIVSGDADQDESVYERLGEVTQQLMERYLPQGHNIVVVTGGSTLSKIGASFTPEVAQERELMFVPARGGVGGSYDIQSNNVAGMMASKTHSMAIPFYVPENIGEEASRKLLDVPEVVAALEYGKQANCLISSVGVAKVMAQRNNVQQEQLQQLEQEGAIGEAFGTFFNREGEEVMRLPRQGVQLEDLARIPLPLTVVAGSSKAEATTAHYKIVPRHGWLICDEGLANQVLSGITTR